MKKTFTTSLIISSLILAPALQADVAPVNTNSEDVQVQDMQNLDLPTDEGVPVSPAADDTQRKAARSKRWQTIGLAIGAVVVAVGAMLLIAHNDGHKKHHDHKNK